LEIEAEYLSEDKFGQVKSMTLFLEGSPARVKLQNQPSTQAIEGATGSKIYNVIALDPSCSCSECMKSKHSLQTLIQDTATSSASVESGTQPSPSLFTGLGESHNYMPQNQTTITYTGLEGSELRNTGPQYTSTDLSLDAANEMMRKLLLQSVTYGEERRAGVASLDVESEMEMEMEVQEEDLWCLRVNVQFGLLLKSCGVVVDKEGPGDGEVGMYRRVGLVKLMAGWMPEHEIRRLAIL